MTVRPTAKERREEVRRLFVAVDPPSQAVAHLGAVVDRLEVSQANEPGRSTRLAVRDRWHVTLAFLGDVPVRRIDTVVAALTAAAEGAHPPPGSDVGPETNLGDPMAGLPRVCFAGGGTFGRGRSIILWVGLGGDVPGLRRLAQVVRGHLRRAHVSFDTKSFRPHLTISRPGARVEPERIEADVSTLLAYRGPIWTVGAVHLYASEIVNTPTGPQPKYTQLASTPLD